MMGMLAKELEKFVSVEGINLEQTPQTSEEQLVLQGKALEDQEKTHGIWQSVKLHKVAIAYCKLLDALLLYQEHNSPTSQV